MPTFPSTAASGYIYPKVHGTAAVIEHSTGNVLLGSPLFWDVRQHRLVVSYRRFGTRRSHLQWTARHLKMIPTGCPETSVTTNLCCVTSQKSEDVRCLKQFKCFAAVCFLLLECFHRILAVGIVIGTSA
jgi:hypothetical protein